MMLTLSIVFISLLIAGQTRTPMTACDPNLVLVNGRIYTVDASKPWADAVAICNDQLRGR